VSPPDSTITSLVGRVLSSPADRFLSALESGVYSDAVKVQTRDDGASSALLTDDRDSFVYRRLGHLTVNPNKPGSNDALVASYVWSTDIREGVVNNSSAARLFIERLITAAHDARSHAAETFAPDAAAAAAQSPGMFVLHGDRGVGKTIFLNYLLGRFASRLDDAKVVWVRVNLVDDFLPYNNLRNWIYAQASKVLLRYYDVSQATRYPNSTIPLRLDFISHLKDFIADNYTEAPRLYDRYFDSIVQLARVLRSAKDELPLSEDLVPPILGAEVMNFARTEGYSFIVVLDGLDLLDITRGAKEKFDDLSTNAELIAESRDTNGYALVVASRTETLRNSHSSFSEIYRSAPARSFAISHVNLDDIIDKRLTVIETEVTRLARQWGWNVSDWPLHIRDYHRRLFGDPNDEYYPGLLMALGHNRRAQMQMIQDDYLDHVIGKGSERSYKFLEQLLKGGKRYPPRYYRYLQLDNGEWAHAPADYQPFDSKFLPTFFTFPHLADGPIETHIPHPDALVAGLRCAQLIIADHINQLGDERFAGSLLATEIANINEVLFGYPRSIVYLFLEEFAEFGLVNLHGHLFPQPRDPEIYHVEVTDKLHLLAEKAIYDVAFLNLAAMRAPINRNALDGRHGPPYFLAEYLDSSRRTSVDPWITAKIINSIGLHRLIRHINDKQKRAYQSKRAEIHGRLSRRERAIVERAVIGSDGRDGRWSATGMFDVEARLFEEIGIELRTIVSAFERDRDYRALDKLSDRVKYHFTYWNDDKTLNSLRIVQSGDSLTGAAEV
jgi:hypothetical protein